MLLLCVVSAPLRHFVPYEITNRIILWMRWWIYETDVS